MLDDREKISARFQELSVKSSLSEFVVNSRQLLDIAAVRMAAEAILKNEKPIPAQGDQSSKLKWTKPFLFCLVNHQMLVLDFFLKGLFI